SEESSASSLSAVPFASSHAFGTAPQQACKEAGMLARKKRARRDAVRDTMKSVQSTVDTVVRRLVGSTDPEYEDLVQSSLVNVLATFDGGKFRGDCPPRGWAAVIARNVAVDAIRARARERRVISHD